MPSSCALARALKLHSQQQCVKILVLLCSQGVSGISLHQKRHTCHVRGILKPIFNFALIGLCVNFVLPGTIFTMKVKMDRTMNAR